MITAAIHGPGGAWISGTKASAADDWDIVWGVNTTFTAEWASKDPASALAKIEGQLARLEDAKTWIRYMANGAALAALDEKATRHRDPAGLGPIEVHLYADEDPIMKSLQQQLDAAVFNKVRNQPIAPQAFDKDELLRVLERAKTYDQRPRWKVAVESREVFMAAYGGRLGDTDPPGRMENLTGTYGSLLGIPVIVDPEIKGWEIRDAHTGEKVQFVTDPTTKNRYWFPGHNTLFLGGESNAETDTGSDSLGTPAEDPGRAGEPD